jgi:hypothetical protein
VIARRAPAAPSARPPLPAPNCSRSSTETASVDPEWLRELDERYTAFYDDIAESRQAKASEEQALRKEFQEQDKPPSRSQRELERRTQTGARQLDRPQYEVRTGVRTRRASQASMTRLASRASGIARLFVSRDGRYWARTSDPQLVEPAPGEAMCGQRLTAPPGEPDLDLVAFPR